MTMNSVSHQKIIWLMISSAVGWGLWWIPVRALTSLGMSEVWAGVLPIFAAALGMIALLKWQNLNPLNLDAAAKYGGLLFGIAISFYGVALALTDVVRAALFFYLAPIWALIIETIWLRVRLSWHGPVGAAICLLGILILFEFQVALDQLNLGDIMATLSGLAFSIGSTCIFSGHRRLRNQNRHIRITSIMLISGAFCGTAMLFLFNEPIGSVDDIGWGILIVLTTGILLLAPISFIMQIGAERLLPATLALLYTGEIATSVVTAAIFLPFEQFGWAEGIGALLIAGAGLAQLFRPQNEEV